MPQGEKTHMKIYLDRLFRSKREKRSQPQKSGKKRKHLKIKFYSYRVTESYYIQQN